MSRITFGVLKEFELGTAIAGSALLGAQEAKAEPIEWGKVEDVETLTQ